MYSFCIDIDNCITQTDSLMRQIIYEYTNGNIRLEYKDITNFDYYKCKDQKGNCITKVEWTKIHEIFSEPQNILKLKPAKEAIKNLHKLAKLGSIHLVTTRIPKARETTIKWLETYELLGYDLHFLKHREKHLMFKSFTAAIEDDYDQAIEFVNSIKTPCYILRHPWNSTREANNGIKWVNDWDTLFQEIKLLINSNS